MKNDYKRMLKYEFQEFVDLVERIREGEEIVNEYYDEVNRCYVLDLPDHSLDIYFDYTVIRYEVDGEMISFLI